MAPPDSSLTATSLMLSVAVATLAALLGWRQWWEHRERAGSVSETDRRHFHQQDLRRTIGVLLMVILALGIYIGSRIPPKISDFPLDADFKDAVRGVAGAWVVTWVNGQANPRFVAIWLVMFVVLAIVLALALFDWRATRRYARRQRQALAGERLEILRETFQPRDTRRNGLPLDPGPGRE